MVTRLRRILLGGLALSSALAIGIGGTAQAHVDRHHPHHHHHSSIPQHNGGDHDADNNGGPSDGDGAL
jgi:hypothetical protein